VKAVRTAVLFTLLFGFWSALSGRFGPSFVVSGLLVAAITTWASVRLLDVSLGSLDDHPRVRVVPFLAFCGWLVTRQAVSAVTVGRTILTPGAHPDPGIATFRTQLGSPAARAILANAITLVPGTNTLENERGEFTIHAFTRADADDIASGAMERRIGAIFGQRDLPAPTITWVSGAVAEGN
jgi:multicomponent Na+:H+ antiporter subunit E